MKYYKVRQKSTGLFSTGGTHVEWKKDGGKIWTKFPSSHFALHGTTYASNHNRVPFEDVEVVVYELVEQSTVPVAEFRKEQLARKQKREEASKKRAAQYDLKLKKACLEQLRKDVARLERETNER